jgi:hypothetical protein
LQGFMGRQVHPIEEDNQVRNALTGFGVRSGLGKMLGLVTGAAGAVQMAAIADTVYGVAENSGRVRDLQRGSSMPLRKTATYGAHFCAKCSARMASEPNDTIR